MDSLYWTSSGNATYIAGAVVCQIAGASPGGLLTVLSQNAWLGADFWSGGVFQSPGQGCASLTRVGGSSVTVSAHVRPASAALPALPSVGRRVDWTARPQVPRGLEFRLWSSLLRQRVQVAPVSSRQAMRRVAQARAASRSL